MVTTRNNYNSTHTYGQRAHTTSTKNIVRFDRVMYCARRYLSVLASIPDHVYRFFQVWTYLWFCVVCATSDCSSCRICAPRDCGRRNVCRTRTRRNRWDGRRTEPCTGPPAGCCSATTGNTERTSAAPNPPWTRYSLFGSGTLVHAS